MTKYQVGKILFVCSLVFISGCKEQLDQLKDKDHGSEVDMIPIPDPRPDETPVDPDTLVCNPFNSGTVPEDKRHNAIRASLFNVGRGGAHLRKAEEYQVFGEKLEGLTMFFNQLHVPTRPFDRGFITESGKPILTPDGDTLFEYFGLKFEGQIGLAEGEEPGLYQFAILSDDGAVLKLKKDGNGLVKFVDNDGNHPTRFGCASEPIQVDADSAIPFELDYYQGPRFHIALTLMWKKWDGNANDPECGRYGNSRYFRYWEDPVVPQSKFNELLDRGWKVLKPDNFKELPDAAEKNPCDDPAPQIIEINVVSVTANTVTIAWKTDIPATSKLTWTNLFTNEIGETVEDTELVTDHIVTATGLSPNTVYDFQAVSSSSSGKTVISEPPSRIRTPRR